MRQKLVSQKAQTAKDSIVGQQQRKLMLMAEEKRLRSIELQEFKTEQAEQKRLRVLKVFHKHKSIQENLERRKKRPCSYIR